MSVLSDQDREKYDETSDDRFYRQPRFVTHVDDEFLQRLTGLYADLLSPADRVFDAMSSHVSHLPKYQFERVVGHGMNEQELAANDALDEYFCQNLNEEQDLPLTADSFDAVLCAVSVQYLQYPEAVFSEFARVLDRGGVLVVSFSHRMFPTKAIRAWRQASMAGRADLVCSYVDAAGAFGEPETVRERPGEDPFSAVLAVRS